MPKLTDRIEQFLRTGAGEFETLALELFQFQYESNRPYQAYCMAQDIGPAHVTRWQDIPAVPIGAFKSAELTTFPVGRAAALFESSGTTLKTPSRHFLNSLTYYETAVKASFSQWVLPDQASLPFLILAPAPGEAPRSSLTWMFDVVKRQWGAAGSQYFVQRGRLDELWLATMLKKAEALKSPVALLGTTIAFLALFDHLRSTGKKFTLPAGSRVMDTGGMKTTQREISRPQFVQNVGELLGISAELCINEYGMCELSSQFYAKGLSIDFTAPPWVRTQVIDAATGQGVNEGATGLLRHFDLANVDSVLAIQTEDLGMRIKGGIQLIGRAPQAEMKGCSISAERISNTLSLRETSASTISYSAVVPR